MNDSYPISYFTKLKYTGEFQNEYDKHAHPAYETFCCQLYEYMPAYSPEDVILYMHGAIQPHVLETFEATKEGNLPRLQAMHRVPYTAPLCLAMFEAMVMSTALKYRHLHIVDYLYYRGPERYKGWNFKKFFPILVDLGEAGDLVEDDEDKSSQPTFITRNEFDEFRLKSAVRNQQIHTKLTKTRKKLEEVSHEIISFLEDKQNLGQ